jgi:integrase
MCDFRIERMASLTTNKTNKRKSIQFDAPDGGGRRPIIRLGNVSMAEAENVRRHVGELVNAVAANRTEDWKTTEWMKTIAPKLLARLVEVGLVKPRRGEEPVPLDAFLAEYIAKRTDLKPRTRSNLEQARRKLVEFFGPARNLRGLTRGDAGDWRRSLKLSRATVSTHVKKAKQFFADAVDRKLLAENPFAGLKAGKQANEARMRYVPVADIRRVIDKCPTPEWKLLFALARFGGLRVPSESELLEWTDIDWKRGRMTVRSPKTEHHEGRGSRLVPLFPELVPFLQDAQAAAGPGARHVLARLRTGNPRTTAVKIVGRAKLEVWPKLFQNLRSSCQTDLSAKHPQHVVCAWLGNTEAIARKHYLQVTEADFDAAAGTAKSDAKSDAENTGSLRSPPRKTPDFPSIPVGSGASQYPQGGENSKQKRLENGGISNQAMRKSLQNGDSADFPRESADLSRVTRAAKLLRAEGRTPSVKAAFRKTRELTKGGRR